MDTGANRLKIANQFISTLSRLGLNGFSNPMRDPKTEEFKELIGHGAKVKMDESGNILLKRLSSSQVFVKNPPEDSAVSNDLMKLPQGLVDIEKPFRVFDMRKFQQNVNRELRRTNPDRLRSVVTKDVITRIIKVYRTAPVLYNNDNLLSRARLIFLICHFHVILEVI